LLKTVERALIRKAKRGDAASIERLIRSHQEPLFAFMLRLSGRPDVAEDMVQEAFVRVLRNLDRFDDRFRFSTWLFTIARRLYVNHLQKHRPSYDSEKVGDWQGGTASMCASCSLSPWTRSTRNSARLSFSSISRTGRFRTSPLI
jgi:RNA polymerase sigma-70 factor, ECF subfamily